MTDLIAILSTQCRGHILKVLEEGGFDKGIMITNEEDKAGFSSSKPVEFLIVDNKKPIKELVQDIYEGIKGKVNVVVGKEVGVNMASGNGKDHMALFSALIRLGIGFRIVVLTKEGVVEV